MTNSQEYDKTFYEDLFENSTAISTVTDVDGVIKTVNKRALEMFFSHGHDASRVIGKNILEFIYKDDRPKVMELWKKSIAELKEINYEIRMSAGDGRIMYFLISGRPIVKDGKVVLFHFQALNMIDQKVQEQNLLQSTSVEIVAQLAGGFAHDFNNLLTVINGYSEILKISIDEVHPFYHKVDQICHAGQQASILTQRLLDFSRKNRPQTRPLDVNEEIISQESIIKHVVGQNIMVNFVKAPGLRAITMDPAQFTNLMINLTLNAKAAMPKGGEITICTEHLSVSMVNEDKYPDVPHGDYLSLTFSDTGEGMTEEVKEKIFNPFFSTRENGKGIGLWTVKNIIKASRGFIFVETGPGSGTVFSMLLPFSEEETEKKEVSFKRLRPESSSMGSKTVLVVEDDDTVRDLVSEVLKQQGHVTLTARNGGDALQLARQLEGHIDLLITDMVMRRIDGRMLSQKMKSIWPHIKVMIMSGYGGDVINEEDLKEDVFLQKPFLPQELVDKVQSVFGG